MHWRLSPALAAAVIACGGANPASVESPPASTPGAPAGLVIVSGDGQSADPGSPLPAQAAVLVKDAAGRTVPNVTVHFSADAGGGSIADYFAAGSLACHSAAFVGLPHAA